jgi:hypothetical protein
MATKSFGFKEIVLSAPAWTTCTFAILPWRRRRSAAGKTRMTSAVLSPARPQKNQQSGSPAKLPSCMYASAEGSVSLRSQRETAMADVLICWPNSPWVSFRARRKARILRDHSGALSIGFRRMRRSPEFDWWTPDLIYRYINPNVRKIQVFKKGRGRRLVQKICGTSHGQRSFGFAPGYHPPGERRTRKGQSGTNQHDEAESEHKCPLNRDPDRGGHLRIDPCRNC